MISFSLMLGVAAAVPVSVPKAWSARERAAAEAVTERVLAAHVKMLADDLLEGRGAGSRGDALAMRYVAAEYERLGLEPAGDAGSYLQKLELVGMKSEAVRAPVFQAGAAKVEGRAGADLIVSPGRQAERASLDGAELVFVGYGITAPEQKWDDWKGVDVKGKVVLVMNSDPESDPALFAGKTRLYYGRWSYKFEEAARHGAAGVIIIHTEPSAGYPWQVVQTSWGREQFELPVKEGEKRVQVRMWATEELSKRIAALAGKDLDAMRKAVESREFQPIPLGVKVSVGLSTKLRRLETANVVGRLAGSDPALGKEAVVVTAHHDHLGIGEAKNGDAIYNGALDNATGVAALLATAEGLVAAKAKLKRSVLFAAVAAEESGLIGSEYFCAHPPVPVGKLTANVNVDGFNIWGRTSDVTIVGMGKSTLDEVVKRAAGEQGREVTEDAFPDKGTFYRSDQFNFAKVGVPALYLKGGMKFLGRDGKWGQERVEEFVKERYHQPSDQVDQGWKWSWEGAVDDVRLLAVVVMRVADGKAAPVWRRGDEFEKVRTKN